MAIKKPQKQPVAGAPTWMVTFADLMALLLTMFVLLLSFAEMDVTKYKNIAGAMKDSFGISHIMRMAAVVEIDGLMNRDAASVVQPVPIPKTVEVEKAEEMPDPTKQVGNEATKGAPPEKSANEIAQEEMIEDLQAELASELSDGEIEVEAKSDGVLIRFPDKTAFPAGTDVLTENFIPTLEKVANVLSKADQTIVVAGHTDNAPISTDRYRSNWDLSASRAISVVHYLLQNTPINPAHITAQGFAESRPLTSNDTPENRARNRRVEITLTPIAKAKKDDDPVEEPAEGSAETPAEEAGDDSVENPTPAAPAPEPTEELTPAPTMAPPAQPEPAPKPVEIEIPVQDGPPITIQIPPSAVQ